MSNPEPGQVLWLPAEDGSHDKDADRPHVVLSPADQNDVVITLAFGTGSRLQADDFKASHVAVESTSPLFHATGFSKTTVVYPSRLACCLTAEAPSPGGRVIDDFPALRDVELPLALGLGTGTTAGTGRAKGSRRGTIAKLRGSLAEGLECDYALVVTAPAYSKEEQIQNIIPMFDTADFAVVAPAFGVAGKSWVEQLTRSGRAPDSPDVYAGALFMTQLIQSAYVRDDIAGYFPIPVDDETMAAMDEALAHRLFGARLVDVLGGPAGGHR